MGTITYDVAVSLDGYISGHDDDISRFPMVGDHVEAYLARLAEYDAVIMGRKTYEFGYQYGLEPGQAPYPNMDHYIISRTIKVPSDAVITIISENITNQVSQLKNRYNAIYLCGGGELAGLLLNNGLIDRLCLKVAPVILGQGVKLFAKLEAPTGFSMTTVKQHESGVNTVIYTRSCAQSE